MTSQTSKAHCFTPNANKSDLRGRVCGLLRKAKLPKSNLTKVQRSALKDLRAMDDVIILPADKGNATVVMSKEEYDRKIMTLGSHGTPLPHRKAR